MVVFKSSEGAAVEVSSDETRITIMKEDVRGHSLPDLSMYPKMTAIKIDPDCDLHDLHSLSKLDPSRVPLESFESWADSLRSITELTKFPLTEVQVSWGRYRGLQIPEFRDTLQRLTVAHTGVTSIHNLSVCNKLVKLQLVGNEIEDLSPLSGITTLRFVDVSVNPIRDLTPLLASARHLEVLYIYRTKVVDLSMLSKCLELRKFKLGGTRVTDLSPLANCTSLQNLQMWGTDVTDLSALSNLTLLRNLSINSVKPMDVGPLCSLVDMISLSANWCDLTDISFIECMPKLQVIQVHRNNIQKLPDFTKVPGPLYIDLTGNPLETKDSLVLQRLGTLVARGDTVRVYKEALDRQSNFMEIEPALRANNVEASDDLAARVAAFCKPKE